MSITSSTDICNLALDLLSAGTVQDIDNPTSATEEVCARWYDHTRKKLLREHPWNFASKRAQLAASSEAPLFGYSKKFPVPADFVRLLSITDTTFQNDHMIRPDDYQFEQGEIMVSNNFSDNDLLNIRYVYDIKNVPEMDELFINLLAYDLALVLAYKFTETNTNIERINSLMKTRSAIARAIDGQERPPTLVQRSVNRAARRSPRGNRNNHRIIF